jgi:hypothetical protein
MLWLEGPLYWSKTPRTTKDAVAGGTPSTGIDVNPI